MLELCGGELLFIAVEMVQVDFMVDPAGGREAHFSGLIKKGRGEF